MTGHAEHPIPTFQDIQAASARISDHVRKTPVVFNSDFNQLLGCLAWFKCENLQETGAFKMRGASNAVLKLREAGIGTGVATHSSGNHGAALARAAKADGREAWIVMPNNSVPAKIDAVRSHGGHIVLCAPNQKDREAGLENLVQKGLLAIPPYEHTDIIAGQGTAALELLQEQADLDFLMAPVGGGGLVSGSGLVARHINPNIKVLAIEPAGAADTFQRFHHGIVDPRFRPQTMADGLRAVVGELTFSIIKDVVDDVLTVTEEGITRGVELVSQYLGMVIEPSSATVVAAMLEHPRVFAGKRVGTILSGENIDRALFPQLFAGGND